MNAATAIARLTTAGYTATPAADPSRVVVQDPYQSNRGNGYNVVTVRVQDVSRFIEARK